MNLSEDVIRSIYDYINYISFNTYKQSLKFLEDKNIDSLYKIDERYKINYERKFLRIPVFVIHDHSEDILGFSNYFDYYNKFSDGILYGFELKCNSIIKSIEIYKHGYLIWSKYNINNVSLSESLDGMTIPIVQTYISVRFYKSTNCELNSYIGILKKEDRIFEEEFKKIIKRYPIKERDY